MDSCGERTWSRLNIHYRNSAAASGGVTNLIFFKAECPFGGELAIVAEVHHIAMLSSLSFDKKQFGVQRKKILLIANSREPVIEFG